jgi:YD repeat-containing protein
LRCCRDCTRRAVYADDLPRPELARWRQRRNYTYDNDNNLTGLTNRDGTTVTYTYDALNHPRTKVFSADAANSVGLR